MHIEFVQPIKALIKNLIIIKIKTCTMGLYTHYGLLRLRHTCEVCTCHYIFESLYERKVSYYDSTWDFNPNYV